MDLIYSLSFISLIIAWSLLAAVIYEMQNIEALYFSTVLVSQELIQLSDSSYLQQSFIVNGIPLMSCNIFNRIVEINEQWVIGETYYLHLTVDCIEIPKPKYITYIPISISLFILTFIIIIFKNYYCPESQGKLIFRFIFNFITAIFSIIILTVNISDILTKKNTLKYSGVPEIHLQSVYLNSHFKYCHLINATVSNEYITCENVLYVGNCFYNYDKALENKTPPECSFNMECLATYDQGINPFNQFIIIFFTLTLLIPTILIIYEFYNYLIYPDMIHEN